MQLVPSRAIAKDALVRIVECRPCAVKAPTLIKSCRHALCPCCYARRAANVARKLVEPHSAWSEYKLSGWFRLTLPLEPLPWNVPLSKNPTCAEMLRCVQPAATRLLRHALRQFNRDWAGGWIWRGLLWRQLPGQTAPGWALCLRGCLVGNHQPLELPGSCELVEGPPTFDNCIRYAARTWRYPMSWLCGPLDAAAATVNLKHWRSWSTFGCMYGANSDR